MPWLALLTNRWTWIIAAFALCCAAVGVQTMRLKLVQAEYATFQAAVAKEAADAKVKAAQVVAQQALAAQEVLSDLQTRHDALSARYASLRARSGSSPVPALPGAAPSPSPVAGGSIESDADARCVAVLETADREIAKYVELWRLEKKNSAARPI